MQDSSSIEIQQRKCREWSGQNGHQMLPEFEFRDEGISGTKLHRAGLDALLAAAAPRKFQVLYFFSLSRLARESVISMPILKLLVYVHKVRVISPNEGVDSDRPGWEIVATMLCLHHDRFIKDLSENVFRGQENNLFAGFSNGDYCFAYRGEPVPGTENSRRGRNARPRMVYIIDRLIAPWVLAIFSWFVIERRSLTWIARELNRLGAPKDHRAKTKTWRHQYVTRILRNRKYIGVWPWGQNKNTRNPLTGVVVQEKRAPEECDKWTRHLPQLQLVDGELFNRAQALLDQNAARCGRRRDRGGKFRETAEGKTADHPRHLLSRLIICRDCEQAFNVGGTNGKYLFCPGYRPGVCECGTKLRRERAERLILELIGQQILINSTWSNEVFAALVHGWKSHQQNLPTELAAKEASLAETERKIGRLVDHLEEDENPDPNITARLAEHRAKQKKLTAEVELLRQRNELREAEPTKDWMAQKLEGLHQTLIHGGPAAAYALRDLVGGQIVVEEIRRAGKKRHFLRGEIRLRISNTAKSLSSLGVDISPSVDDLQPAITLDFVDPNPMDNLAEQAKSLWDQGMLKKQIAVELDVWPSQVTKFLKHWSKLHGEELPDGRSRRSLLDQKSLRRPQYQTIADSAKSLWDDPAGLAVVEIARQLGTHDTMVRNALAYWHRIRGLPVPTAKDRRNRNMQRAMQMYSDDIQVIEIAKTLGYSKRGMNLLLKECFARVGQQMPDGRSRRHRCKKAG